MTHIHRIFRYPLPIADELTLDLPWPGRILSVAASRDESAGIDLWAEARAGDRRTVKRQLYIIGTGHPRSEEVFRADFVGTVVTKSGLVWHVFARHLL